MKRIESEPHPVSGYVVPMIKGALVAIAITACLPIWFYTTWDAERQLALYTDRESLFRAPANFWHHASNRGIVVAVSENVLMFVMLCYFAIVGAGFGGYLKRRRDRLQRAQHQVAAEPPE